MAAVDAPPRGPAAIAEEVPAPPLIDRRPSRPRWVRWGAWIAGIGAAISIGLQLRPGFPERWVIDLTNSFGSFELWIIENDETHWLWVFFFTPLKDAVNFLFDGLVTGLSRMTWLGATVAAAALAGFLAGWRQAIVAACGFLVMAFLGLWEASIETLALILVSVTVALVVGVPLGVWAGRNDRIDRILRPILDAMQTIPAFSYLIVLVLFFSIGTTTALIATVIFALPPAIRLTSLGIRGVPATTLEVGRAYGSTDRQILRRIQLPLAMPSIMLGLNQTLMMALGMVVIAAVVGFQGLGREVYNGLQRLNVGEALNGGIAIVIMAIVLDRVSLAWSQRDRRRRGRKDVDVLGRSLPRRTVGLVALGVAIVAIVIGREVLRQQGFPENWTVSVGDPTNAIVDWVTRTFGGVTESISNVMIRRALDPLRYVLVEVPWWMVAGGTALLAWRVSKRWTLALMAFLCLAAIGVLGMWNIAMDTLSQVTVAVVISVAIAVPIGIMLARSDPLEASIKPILDAMQTMPAFVYLVPVIALFNVGRIPGVIAALVYALPPCIRLTDLGIRQVPQNTIEAGRAYGSTSSQLLRKVQLPLARPSILLGVNQTIMMVLSVVIIAGLVGGGGLGLEVIKGLTHDELGRGLVGGICILLLAIVIDRITQAMGMESRSLRGPVGSGLGWWTRIQALREGKAKEAFENVGKGES
jgi:glycine betaine/proline transport system permease protein